MHQKFLSTPRSTTSFGAFSSAPDPDGGAYDAYDTLPPSMRSLWRLDLGASILTPPPNKIPGYAYGSLQIPDTRFVSLCHPYYFCWYSFATSPADTLAGAAAWRRAAAGRAASGAAADDRGAGFGDTVERAAWTACGWPKSDGRPGCQWLTNSHRRSSSLVVSPPQMTGNEPCVVYVTVLLHTVQGIDVKKRCD